MVRWVFALVLLLAGCAHASWETAKRAPDYSMPRVIPIWVDITDEAERADVGGYSAAMVQAMEHELVELGYEPRIFTPAVGGAKEARHLPRAELLIRMWNEGDAAAGLVPHLGEPEMIIDCVVFSAHNKAIFSGSLRASQTASDWADPRSAVHTADIAGRLVGRTLAGR